MCAELLNTTKIRNILAQQRRDAFDECEISNYEKQKDYNGGYILLAPHTCSVLRLPIESVLKPVVTRYHKTAEARCS